MLMRRDTSSVKKPKSILIVDDDERLARLTQVALQRVGYTDVHVETSCRRGLAAAYERIPDVLILDVVLPDGSGGDIAAEVRRRKQFANTSIVFLTGVISKREVYRYGGAIGGDRYLAKPASLSQLVSAIEEEAESVFDPKPPAEVPFYKRFRIPMPFSLTRAR